MEFNNVTLHTNNNSNGNVGKEYFFFLQRMSLSNLLHSSNLPINVDVDTDEKDEGEETVYHQVKIDEIDLDVERVRS